MKRTYLILSLFAVVCLRADAARVRRSDIPGDGVIPCGPTAPFDPLCPGGVGSVSLSSGALTGVLQQGGSTFGINLTPAATVLTFTTTPANPNSPPNYNPEWSGPLGLNPFFQPTASHVGKVGLPPKLPPSLSYFDATVPISGQEIKLNVTNNGATNLNSVSFYLGQNLASLSSATQRQNDGLTFGVYCTGQTHAEGTPNDCALPGNRNLLLLPSGPGSLNPDNLDPSSAVFGDVLQFSNINLAPGRNAQFAFFLSDYSSTRTPPGDVFVPANQSFVVELDPAFAPVPEPDNAVLVVLGLLTISLVVAHVKWTSRIS
jgi:hypothetical protein